MTANPIRCVDHGIRLPVVSLGLPCLLLLSIQPPAGQEEPVEFLSSLPVAFEEARRISAPVLFLVADECCDRELGELLEADWFRRRSRDFVCLAAHPGLHPTYRSTTYVRGLRRIRMACRLFGHCTCREHGKVWKELPGKLPLSKDGEGKVRAPQLLFLKPDGTRISHWGILPTRKRLEKELDLSSRAMKEPSDSEQDKEFLRLRKRFLRASPSSQKLLAKELAGLPLLEAREFLFSTCLSPKEKVRRRAAILEVIGIRGSYLALEVLVRGLKERDLRLQLASLKGMAEVRLPAAVPPILAWYRSRRLRKGSETRACAMALLFSHPHDPGVLAWFRDILEGRELASKLAALEALLELENPREDYRKILAGLLDSNNRLKQKAAEVLSVFENRK